MDCFISSDPAALNATLLYDVDEDNEDFWRRSNQDIPLPLCSSFSSPPDSRCLVCVDRVVHAVCHNLTRVVKMMMEAGGHNVKISKSDCPKPPFGDAPQSQLSDTMTYILPVLLVFVLLVVVFIINRKCCRNPEELRGDEINTHNEEEPTEPPGKETEII